MGGHDRDGEAAVGGGAPAAIFLERARWIPGDLAVTLRRMVGLRNILVHGYETVDVWIVADIVAHRLDDLLAFSSVIRSKLD